MNDEDMTGGETHNDFWGGTPDWTDAPQRPQRAKRSGDVTGAIKGLWSSAMSAGASATREHRVFDATANPKPADEIAVDPRMFDDLDDLSVDDGDSSDDTFSNDTFSDDDFLAVDRRERVTDSGETVHFAGHPTGEVPVIDVFDEDTLAAVSMSERAPRRRGAGGLDPLLVRVGAVAIATTLLVPLIIGLSSEGETTDTISSATATATASIDDATPSDDTPLAADSVATDATTTPAGLDPASLPPAVPVVTDAEASTPESSDQSADSSDDTSTDTSTGLVAASATSESDTFADTASASESLESGTTGSETDSSDTAGVDGAATVDDGAERVASCGAQYTVVAGDYWLRLADAANVSLAELLGVNSASTDTPLYPGSEICLPAGATTPAPPATVTQPEATTTTAPPTTTAPATTAPATTAPPTTAAPSSTTTSNTDATPEEVEQIIRDVWPDELEEKALQIAFRESSLVPTAKNYCCYGLFQMYWEVHKSWLAGIGITDDQQLFDPDTNARAAYALYQRSGGWGPWSQTAY